MFCRKIRMKHNEVRVEIIRLTTMDPEVYYTAIAGLHIGEIHHGVLPLLGESYLSKVYFELARLPESGVWAAVNSNGVVGFLTGSSDIRRSYRSVIWRMLPTLVVFGLRSAKDLRIVRKLVSVLIYPFQQPMLTSHSIEECNDVNSEILAIAVSPAYQRRGIGQLLIKSFERGLQQRNIRGYYRVATNLAEPNSNAFYRNAGFIPCHQVKHNDLILQIYVKKVSEVGVWA